MDQQIDKDNSKFEIGKLVIVKTKHIIPLNQNICYSAEYINT